MLFSLCCVWYCVIFMWCFFVFFGVVCGVCELVCVVCLVYLV